jgi:hypothetical protein
MDGDASDTSSALELAIDTHCTIFLSSSEAQSGTLLLQTIHGAWLIVKQLLMTSGMVHGVTD